MCSAPRRRARGGRHKSARRPSRPRAVRPSASIETTSAPVTSSAPAVRAAAASAADSAPMPPTGTSQLPPTTWYRKQRFWRNSGSSAGANVPINPSVRTVPRVTSLVNVRSIRSDSGVSNSESHVASSSRRRRISSRERSGSVRVGKIRFGDVRQHRSGTPRAASERRISGDPASSHLDRDAEGLLERHREQAHEVGVAREPNVEAGERRGRDGGSADLIAALEHDDRAAGAREQRRGDQRVVTAAGDHRVEAASLGHATNVLGLIASGERAAAVLVCGP